MIEIREKGLLYLQFEEFNKLGLVKHLFTTRVGWTKKDHKEQLATIFDVEVERVINVKQVHKTDILVMDSVHKLTAETPNMEYDGLITHLPKLVLTTYHADCVPIYFVDRKNKVIGMAHGGWKGTLGNISGKMIDTMMEAYDSQIEDILVAIGPSIGSCCYEVGKDVSDLFIDRYREYEDIIISGDGKNYLDLWKVNYLQLREKGIPEENIILSNLCTSCNVDKLYSYRKERGTDERIIAGISLI